MTDTRLTVIVPTYNRCDLLRACLTSMEAQTYRDFTVLVVDDGSAEDVAGFVEAEFPLVLVLRLSTNRGFAAAVNAGIGWANSPLIALFNNDMTLASDCLELLVAAVENARADMVAPLVVWKDAPDTIYSAGDRQLANGRPESIGFRTSLAGFSFDEPVFGVSAGAAVYRREVFDAIGGLDEAFHAYFEDSDLNLRARLAGFSAACETRAVAYHVGSASLEGRTWWRARQCYRNHCLLVAKNFPSHAFARHFPAILRERFHQAARCFSSARAEFGFVRALAVLLTASCSTVAAIPAALLSRSRIQRSRVLNADEFEALLR